MIKMVDDEIKNSEIFEEFIDETIENLKKDQKDAKEDARIKEFDQRLEKIQSMLTEGQKIEAKDALNDII